MTNVVWKKEGYYLRWSEVSDEYDPLTYKNVLIHSLSPEGVIVGQARFSYEVDKTFCEVLRADVMLEHRRKGLCTAMYDLAEEIVGKELVPSNSLSTFSYALWKKRRPQSLDGYSLDNLSHEEL